MKRMNLLHKLFIPFLIACIMMGMNGIATLQHQDLELHWNIVTLISSVWILVNLLIITLHYVCFHRWNYVKTLSEKSHLMRCSKCRTEKIVSVK